MKHSKNRNLYVEKAFIALGKKQWNYASMYCDTALNNDPCDSMAYLGKLLSEIHLSQIDDLQHSPAWIVMYMAEREYREIYGYSTVYYNGLSFKTVPRKYYKLYNNAMEYADPVLKEKLSTIAKEAIYNFALDLAKSKYSIAKKYFLLLDTYKDAAEKAVACERIILSQQQLTKVINNFSEVKKKYLQFISFKISPYLYIMTAFIGHFLLIFGIIKNFNNADMLKYSCLIFAPFFIMDLVIAIKISRAITKEARTGFILYDYFVVAFPAVILLILAPISSLVFAIKVNKYKKQFKRVMKEVSILEKDEFDKYIKYSTILGMNTDECIKKLFYSNE